MGGRVGEWLMIAWGNWFGRVGVEEEFVGLGENEKCIIVVGDGILFCVVRLQFVIAGVGDCIGKNTIIFMKQKLIINFNDGVFI